MTFNKILMSSDKIALWQHIYFYFVKWLAIFASEGLTEGLNSESFDTKLNALTGYIFIIGKLSPDNSHWKTCGGWKLSSAQLSSGTFINLCTIIVKTTLVVSNQFKHYCHYQHCLNISVLSGPVIIFQVCQRHPNVSSIVQKCQHVPKCVSFYFQ